MAAGIGTRAHGDSLIRPHHLRSWLAGLAGLVWRNDDAAQLVEFAVSLPLLVVFVVGIFDFSGAYTLKQKLTNVARDAARAAASEPSNDLQAPSSGIPASVNDAFQVVNNYLIANKINNCGVAPSLVVIGPGETWRFSGNSNGCQGTGLVIVINRGYIFMANGGSQPADLNCSSQSAGAQTAVIATCVSIHYAYQWRFGRVASLLGSTTALPSNITATAVAMNEN
jgi:Flp pilus assembly protein TadG